MVHFSYGPLDQLLLGYIVHALENLQAEYRVCHYERARELNEYWKPQVTVFFKPRFEFNREMAEGFKGHTVIWDFEAPYEIDTLVNVANFIPYCFTPDLNSYNLLKERHLYEGRLHYVPYACDPLVHREIDWAYEDTDPKLPYDYRSDLCFIGNAYPSRIKFLEQHAKFLADYQVVLIGIGYRGLAGFRNQKVIHDVISMTEVVRYFNGAKVNLNLFRSADDCHFAEDTFHLKPLSPNCRTFEIAATGHVQVCDNSRKGEIDRMFGESVGQFDPDKPESFQKIFTSLMENPDHRISMGANAKQIALSEHTYQKRITDHLYHLTS